MLLKVTTDPLRKQDKERTFLVGRYFVILVREIIIVLGAAMYKNIKRLYERCDIYLRIRYNFSSFTKLINFIFFFFQGVA